MDLETFRFLQSPEGHALLRLASEEQGELVNKIVALRRLFLPAQVSAAIETLELRKRASRKFSRAEEMFFTREALEQASGETISRYRSERYESVSVLDLGCGIGGDTIALASRCKVAAVDHDPLRLEMARHNVHVYGYTGNVDFRCADVTQIPLNAEAAFLDPSRRTKRGRVVRLDQLSPPASFIQRLTSSVPNCAVKLSPAVPYSDLQRLDAEIEFISHNGECKEAVAWFGDFRSAVRRATVLPERASLSVNVADTDDSPRTVRPPGTYIYDPDPAVVRSHLIGILVDRLGAWNLDPRIAYLSADNVTQTPFAVAYEVLEAIPFSRNALRRCLRKLDVGRVIVKKRGVAFEPVEIEKQFELEGEKEVVLILTRLAEKPWALICTPVPRAGFISSHGE